MLTCQFMCRDLNDALQPFVKSQLAYERALQQRAADLSP